MTLPNHLAGGIVFTGVFGAFAGVNILHHPGLIAMTVAASTIADIDVPSSLWGRTFRPLSHQINRRFGHRTLTHSLLFLLISWSSVYATCRGLSVSAPYPTVYLLAYLSHLILDMMTVQGVPIFYPYNRSPCVIPADPKLRLRANNPRSEIAIFGFFLISGIFLQPLMADGFWTSYNRLFGTMMHLQSEFEKSDDLLRADYNYREATTEHRGHGLVVECTGTNTTLWNPESGWLNLDASPASPRTVLKIIPTHTGRSFTFLRQSFVAISPDSLDRLLQDQPIYALQLSGNAPFISHFSTTNRRDKITTRSLDLQLVERIAIFEKPEQLQLDSLPYYRNPRITTLRQRIEQLQLDRQEKQEERSAYRQRIATLTTILEETNDLYEEQRAAEQLRSLQNASPVPIDINAKLRELNTQILELQSADRIRHAEKRAAALQKLRGNQPPALELTGIATLVSFSPSE